MQKIIFANLFSIFIFLLAVGGVEARLLPRFQNARPSLRRGATGVGVSARLRKDHQALLVYFSNLNKATSITYTLTYQTDGVEQGVSSVLATGAEDSTTRELLFGTCSAGVCRYHPNITGMKFEVVSELASGKKSIKRFRIRV